MKFGRLNEASDFLGLVLLDIIADKNTFCVSIGDEEDGSDLSAPDKDSFDLTFREAVNYGENELPYYRKRYSGREEAAVCTEDGEPIAVYDGKKWRLWKH